MFFGNMEGEIKPVNLLKEKKKVLIIMEKI